MGRLSSSSALSKWISASEDGLLFAECPDPPYPFEPFSAPGRAGWTTQELVLYVARWLVFLSSSAFSYRTFGRGGQWALAVHHSIYAKTCEAKDIVHSGALVMLNYSFTKA
jgi:hypothetical protein